MKNTVIIGANAFYEVSELITDINLTLDEESKINVIGLLDDNEKLHNSIIEGVAVYGNLEKYVDFPETTYFVFAIGSHKTHLIRKQILKKINIDKDRFLTLIHPNAKVYRSATVGQGTIIHYGSIVYSNTVVGPFCIIFSFSTIGVNNIIGEGCLITSNVSTTGGVKVGDYSFIGTSSSISEQVEIGPGSKIAMCSYVRTSVPSGSLVYPQPSKVIQHTEIPEEITENWKIYKSQILS